MNYILLNLKIKYEKTKPKRRSTQYVEENIGTFHAKRIQSLDDLKLSKVLKRKNPYLFKAKYVLTC